MIVLWKRLDDLPGGVHDGQAVFPLGIHSHDSFPFHPELWPIVRVLARSARSRQCRNRSVPPWKAADRKNQARSKIRNQFCRRPPDVRQLAAEEQENAIRILRVDSLSRSPSPRLVSWQRADVGGPIFGDIIRTEGILTSHLARNGRDTYWTSLPEDRPRITSERKPNQAAHADCKNCKQNFTHESPSR